MRGRLPLTALLLGLILGLTACSPPHIGTIGIERNADGTLTVLVRVCRDSVDTVELLPIDSLSHATDGAHVSEATSLVDEAATVRRAAAVLSPPVTLAADVPFPADEGTLDSAVLFEVRASGREGNAFSGLFGAVELRALRPGEVMAEPMGGDPESEYVRDGGAGGVYLIVSLDEFERRLMAFCG